VSDKIETGLQWLIAVIIYTVIIVDILCVDGTVHMLLTFSMLLPFIT